MALCKCLMSARRAASPHLRRVGTFAKNSDGLVRDPGHHFGAFREQSNLVAHVLLEVALAGLRSLLRAVSK
jgi:hypothetical protein